MPSVNDEHHARVESDVKKRFLEAGWSVFNTAHHDTMPEEAVRILSRNNSLGAHLARAQPDCLALTTDCTIKWDAKTTSYPRHENFAIETLPLFVMLSEQQLGQTCLFFCRRHDGAEYVLDPRLVRGHVSCILIPTKRRTPEIMDRVKQYHIEQLSRFGINSEIWQTAADSGSGDPFACIKIDDISTPSFSEYFGCFVNGVPPALPITPQPPQPPPIVPGRQEPPAIIPDRQQPPLISQRRLF